MSSYFVDVHVLVALMWPAHSGHQRAQEWFARNQKSGWATCPFTQASCVRILSNPAFSSDAVTPQEALKLLNANLRHPSHRFWPDDVNFSDAVDPIKKQMVGHQQITDAYLLGLAMRRKARFATMDRAVKELLPEDKRATIVLL